MTRPFVVLLFLWIICLPAVVHGETLVVSQEHPAASDENPGTETRPLKTISAAAGKVKAGDKVVIHRGEYREVVLITASGTETAPILFVASPSETVVIKGSDIISGWKRDEGSVWKAPLRTPPPRGQSAKEAAFWDTNDARQVFSRDGTLFDAQRLRRVRSRHSMEAGTFFCDPTASLLFAWLPDSGSPIEHPPEVAVRGAWLCVFGSHVVVRGIEMRHSSTTPIANWPACNLLGDEITLEDCLITWGDFGGVSLAGNRQRLLNDVIACHGDSGVAGKGQGHLIEGCRVIYNNVDRINPNWHAGGAKFIPGFTHGIIRRNEFAHNLGPGLWLDGSCDENVIDGNFSHDNEGPGITVEISKGNLVANNVSFANRNFLSGVYRDDSGNETQVNHNDQRVGGSRLLRLYHAGDGRGIYISSSPKTKVLNNTVYLNEGEGICVEGPARGEGEAEMSTSGSIVMNNISVFNKGSQLTILPNETSSDKSKAVSDHNLLFSVGAVLAKKGWTGPAAWSIDDWQKSSGQDAHSLDADPQFAMPAMEDFRLLEGSPALGAGKPLPELDHDYFGRPRGQEKTSIGACEAVALNYPEPLWKTIPGYVGVR